LAYVDTQRVPTEGMTSRSKSQRRQPPRPAGAPSGLGRIAHLLALRSIAARPPGRIAGAGEPYFVFQSFQVSQYCHIAFGW
jgi:hypothetical protein